MPKLHISSSFLHNSHLYSPIHIVAERRTPCMKMRHNDLIKVTEKPKQAIFVRIRGIKSLVMLSLDERKYQGHAFIEHEDDFLPIISISSVLGVF